MGQLNAIVNDPKVSAWSMQTADKVPRAELVLWLEESLDPGKKARFVLESLRASLLQDVYDSFLSDAERRRKHEKKPVSWFKKVQFMFLAFCGVLLAICEGFDGIASILGSFVAVPTVLVFVAGITFSILSVAVFYLFDLVDISKQLGVNITKSNKLLDVYLQQVEQIELLRKVIDDCYIHESADEREELRQLVAMLAFRYKVLDAARESYMAALNKPALKGGKLVSDIMTAVFYFSGGFFAGQTLAIAVAGIFVASVSATFWPVVVASAAVGLAALGIYWFAQRPLLKNLVNHWLGLDKQNIEVFADIDTVAAQKQALLTLETKMEQIEALHHEIALVKTGETTGIRELDPEVSLDQMTPIPARMIMSQSGFFRLPRSRSLGDLDGLDHVPPLKSA